MIIESITLHHLLAMLVICIFILPIIVTQVELFDQKAYADGLTQENLPPGECW